MRVAINDFISVRGLSGSSRGASHIGEAIEKLCQVEVLKPKAESSSKLGRLLGMAIWDIWTAPRRAIASSSDLIIHTTNTGGSRRRLKSIVVMHDTMVLDHPSLFDFKFVLYARCFFASAVRRSTLIVTPSEHSANRIRARWPRAQVQTIPWPAFNEQLEQPEREMFEPKRVLIVSSIDKHKRLPLAVSVVADVRRSTGIDLELVIVGRVGNDGDAFSRAVADLDPNNTWVSVRQNLSDTDLNVLYRESHCLLVSSVDEGFCLPALEACCQGLPVVHADRGAVPEIVHWPQSDSRDEQDHSILESRLTRLVVDRQFWDERRIHGRESSRRFSKQAFLDGWTSALRRASA